MAKKRLWVTAPYKDGDEDQVEGLVNASAATPFDAARWRWIFKDSADTVHTEYAWHGDKLVGQYAVVPVPMRIDGRDTTWCISLDTASHPDYRRQGMFTTLARSLYERLPEEGVEVVFGLPNEQSSFGFYKRLDWVRVQPHLMCYQPGGLTSGMRNKLGAAAPIANVLTKVAARARAPVEHLVGRAAMPHTFLRCTKYIPAGTDALCATTLKHPGIRIRYDAERLTWRYRMHPHFNYRFVSMVQGRTLIGLAVIRPPQQGTLVGNIMDVFLADEDDMAAATALVSAAVGHLHQAGSTSISALATPGSALHRAMRVLGFLAIVPKRENWTWSLGARVLGGNAVAGDVYDGKQWRIGLGIHDQL